MNVFKKILIKGHVQGVFFRESTRELASSLQLAGGVRNRFDGSVEVLVAGDEYDVETFINWLKTGPKLAKVSTIEVVDLPSASLPKQLTNGFEVLATK
jgi:acylphosphatase